MGLFGSSRGLTLGAVAAQVGQAGSQAVEARGIVPWARRSGSSTVMSRALACPRNSDGNLAQSVYRKYEIGGLFAQRKIVANQPMHRAIFGRIQTRALTPQTFVRGGAISASAGMFHSRCSFQAILIVRGRFFVRTSDARCREPSRRPRSA